jgi:hypothetical protein
LSVAPVANEESPSAANARTSNHDDVTMVVVAHAFLAHVEAPDDRVPMLDARAVSEAASEP